MTQARQSLSASNLPTEEVDTTNTNDGMVVGWQFHTWLSIAEYR